MKKLLVFCGILFFPLCGFSKSNIALDSKLASEKELVIEDDSLFFGAGERLDSIVVRSWRAGLNTPVAFSELSKKQIRNNPSSHSLPMLLNLQPSVVATTEGGLGLGYSKMSVRGTDDSRTNVTINGICMNDGESQQVFWVNLPSLQSFLKSVQLQRGVGTSINGSGAFGASLNMETINSSQNAYGAAEFSLGSYQTYMTTVAAGSGVSAHGFSFDVVYSHNNTKGYIRNAKADLNSLFATLGWRNDNNLFKLNYIFGDQSTGITWEGCPLDKYETNPRYNVAGEYYDEAGNVHYYDNETDNYRQHYVQAVYTHNFNTFLTWNTTFNFTKGDGYYENYKYNTKFSKYGLEPQTIGETTYKKSDFIIQQAMDNSYYAANTTLAYDKGGLRASASLSYSYYTGDHFGDVLWVKNNNNVPNNHRWYNNNGTKNDYSAYLRAEWDVCDYLTAFADLQYRGVDFKMSGDDKDFVSLKWKEKYNFFNPKAGLTFSINDNSKLYASVAVAHREPSRSDIKESIKAGKQDEINAERLTDVEIGYRFMSEKLTLSANVYFMEYKDQLVATGKLSETGHVIKENIPDSYRRGIELAGAWQIAKALRFDANLTLSKNKLKNYTAYVDTYDNDNDWNPVAQTEVFFSKSNLILSPEIISMAMITLTPGCGFNFSLNGKYVGKQYMDNFNTEISKVPAYFVAGFNASKEFSLRGKSKLNLSFSVDNLFNNKYYAYGWIYQAYFKNGAPNYVEQGIYPQAPINFIAKVAYRF